MNFQILVHMHLKPCTIREILCRLSAITPTSYSALYTSCHAKSIFPYSHKRNSVLYDLSAGEGFFEKCWKEERHFCVYVRNEWFRFCYGKSRVSSSFKRYSLSTGISSSRIGLLYIRRNNCLAPAHSYPSGPLRIGTTSFFRALPKDLMTVFEERATLLSIDPYEPNS